MIFKKRRDKRVLTDEEREKMGIKTFRPKVFEPKKFEPKKIEIDHI